MILLPRYGAPDPHFASVTSQVNFQGLDTSTAFRDEKGIAWTASGNAQIDTAQSLFGGASGLFDGSGDYISASPSAAFNPSNGDFFIELAGRGSTIDTVARTIFTTRPSGGGAATGLQLAVTSSSGFQALGYNSGGTLLFNLISGGGSVVTGAFYRFAVGRSGTVVYLFLDGALEASVDISTATIADSSTVNIGRDPSDIGAARFWHGWLSAWRFTKGVCRHTATYTPDNGPFPNYGP